MRQRSQVRPCFLFGRPAMTFSIQHSSDVLTISCGRFVNEGFTTVVAEVPNVNFTHCTSWSHPQLYDRVPRWVMESSYSNTRLRPTRGEPREGESSVYGVSPRMYHIRNGRFRTWLNGWRHKDCPSPFLTIILIKS